MVKRDVKIRSKKDRRTFLDNEYHKNILRNVHLVYISSSNINISREIHPGNEMHWYLASTGGRPLFSSRAGSGSARGREILSRMRLLADDIVSFSIPLPFFTHLLISLSLKSKARRMREKERERERFARFEDLSSTPNPLFLDCSTLSCFNGCSSSSCSLSLEKGEVFRQERGRSRHSILRFLEKRGGKGGFLFFFLFSKRFSPL